MDMGLGFFAGYGVVDRRLWCNARTGGCRAHGTAANASGYGAYGSASNTGGSVNLPS